MEEQTPSKNTILFTRLLFMFQAAAMQQMGKLANPMTGHIERDLEQVRIAIDTIDMLREKCRGNLNDMEERLLNHILSELRLNFVDEVNRSQVETPPSAVEEPGTPETAL